MRTLATRMDDAPTLFVQDSDSIFALTFSAAVIRRLGWYSGQAIVLREIPANAEAGTKSALLVEAK